MTPSRPLPAVAFVLTFKRPRLATQVVRELLETEGFTPEQVTLVVNGEGGLEDPRLEAAIDVLRLPENLGSAGGFNRALLHVASRSDAPWIYVCEDDNVAHEMPAPRVGELVERVVAFERDRPGLPVGAVVIKGMDTDPGTGASSPHRPGSSEHGLEEVTWGTFHGVLLSRRVIESGVVPDESLFFGATDFDFFFRMRARGFRVLTDCAIPVDPLWLALRAGKESLGLPRRRDEPWCSYYLARNPLVLARRYGNVRWAAHHLRRMAGRFVRSSRAHRAAIARGLIDGLLMRSGKNPAFVREVGEL